MEQAPRIWSSPSPAVTKSASEQVRESDFTRAESSIDVGLLNAGVLVERRSSGGRRILRSALCQLGQEASITGCNSFRK